MSRSIPDSVIRAWPDVDPSAWQWLSKYRLRAPHRVPGAMHLVVVAFGQTLGQSLGAGCSEQQVQETYAQLFEGAARLAAYEAACEDGTPVGDNYGRCRWCGNWPHKHASAGGDRATSPAGA